MIQERYAVLADAVRQVASPQIRNAGTLGGNVCQDTRCWYYRYGLACYRAGGNVCYADTPGAMNREHCILGANRCVAVTPSDPGPGAGSVGCRDGHSERAWRASREGRGLLHGALDRHHADDGAQARRNPDGGSDSATWAGATFYFEKVADRNTWDFALVSVAAAMTLSGNTISDIRIVCGAVQCIPRRLTDAERAVRGSPKNEQTAERAGALAVRGAKPLNYNHFKIPLMENLVKRAIRDA